MDFQLGSEPAISAGAQTHGCFVQISYTALDRASHGFTGFTVYVAAGEGVGAGRVGTDPRAPGAVPQGAASDETERVENSLL